MFGNWLFWKLLTLTLILNCLFGCGGNDVSSPNDGNPVSTITIEKIRGEKVEIVEKIESGLPTIADGVLVGFHSKIIATYAERISWRLNADPAPKTDLMVKVNIGFTNLSRYIPGSNPGDYRWVVIPKFQNKSEEFSDTVYAGEIKIHPLPMVFIDGEGLVVDFEELQEDLLEESHGGHRIPKDFDFPLYEVGDPLQISCERCGEIIDIIITESKLDNDLDVTPPVITSGTVADRDVDVNPAAINADGFQFDFDEPVEGTIKLTDETGIDLHWIAKVGGQTATLISLGGPELVNGTTYKVEIDVQDRAGNQTQTTITFVTEPKR